MSSCMLACTSFTVTRLFTVRRECCKVELWNIRRAMQRLVALGVWQQLDFAQVVYVHAHAHTQ